MNSDKKPQDEREIDVDQLINAINALEPGKLQRTASLFQQLYPTIEQSLARKVAQKKIVESLEQYGLHLSLGGFRSLLEAERKKRRDGNDEVRCLKCGAALPHSVED